MVETEIVREAVWESAVEKVVVRRDAQSRCIQDASVVLKCTKGVIVTRDCRSLEVSMGFDM